MKTANVLHLTDLHLKCPPVFDQQVLHDALLSDLKTLRYEQDAPNLVIFSGDLAQAASVPGSYDPVLDYLLKVLDALGLSEERLVVCPGNHDAKRDIVSQNLAQLEEWRKQSRTRAGANALSEDEKFRTYVGSVFSDYNEIAAEFAKPSNTRTGVFSASYYFRDIGLAVVSLNSASLTATGIDGFDDRGQLFVAERTVVDALNGVPSGVPVLMMAHHPLNWLNEANSPLLDTVFQKSAVAYLSGHIHDATPHYSAGAAGNYINVQSGALYTDRDYWNGYAVVSLSPEGHAKVRYRRWYEKRREFGVAEDIATGGVFYPSEASRAHWSAMAPTRDRDALAAWRDAVLVPHVCEQLDRSLEEGAYFSKPEFEREIPYHTESDSKVGARVESLGYDAIISAQDNYVFYARAETGKTTFLRHAAVSIAKLVGAEAALSIPVVIHFDNFKPYKASIEAALRQQLPDLPQDLRPGGLLQRGELTILIDDVDFGKSEKRKALVSFITDNPKCRYIITTSSTFVDSAAFRPEISPSVPFTFMHMRQIKNGQLLALIEGNGTTDPLKADKLLDRLIREANQLSVPLTAVTGTLLIQIISEDPDKPLLNQAGLIERYIDVLLQRYAPRDLVPGTFDFTNKIDLLGVLAANMVRSGEYCPEEDTMREWCSNYLKSYGLRFSASKLVDYFVESRVFERQGDQVRFRLKMFLEFFIAQRMKEDEEFRDYIFQEERYLEFTNEVGLYAALSRRDLKRLDEVFQAFMSLSEQVWAETGNTASPSEVLNEFKVPHSESSQAELDEIARSFANPEQLRRDRDMLLNGYEAEGDAPSQDVVRPRYESVGERWYAHLVLLSAMLKHTEFVPDWEKRKIMAGVIEGWVKFCLDSLSIVSDLAKERRVVFNGVTYRTTLPPDLSVGEVARRLTLVMPIASARMASTFLGTEKLRLQIEDGLGAATEPAARQLIRVAILADLGVHDLSKPATKVAGALKGNRYLEHVFARKMYEVAVRFRLSKPELAAIQNIAASSFQAIGGKSDRRRAALFDGMAKQRLLLERGRAKG